MNLRQLTILFGALAPSALAQTIALGTQYVDGDPFYDGTSPTSPLRRCQS
jgi:hypothetical protein